MPSVTVNHSSLGRAGCVLAIGSLSVTLLVVRYSHAAKRDLDCDLGIFLPLAEWNLIVIVDSFGPGLETHCGFKPGISYTVSDDCQVVTH